MQQGILYEQRVKDEIDALFSDKEIFHGPWITYVANSRERFAQPDVVVLTPEALIICEIKLTWKIAANKKLENLYAPICSQIWDREKVYTAQICSRMRKGCKITEWQRLDQLLEVKDHYNIHWRP